MANVLFVQGTQAQYEALTPKVETTFYYIDEKDLYLGSKKITNAEDLAAAVLRIKANEDAITVLNGDATTEGSVAKQVAEAIAKIVAEAPEDLDTLKEISDWISDHADDVTAMNTQIAANKKGVEDLEKLVGEIPEDAEEGVETIVQYVDTEIASAVANATLVWETM